MNKTMTTLAGFAVLAAASMVPASAQSFTANGPFAFTLTPTTFDVNNISATFNPQVRASQVGLVSITGGTSTNGTTFTGSTFSFLSGGVTESVTPVDATVSFFPSTSTSPAFYDITGFTLPSGFNTGFTFNLEPGTLPAVPEASTVVSFGALLALGGLAILRRKSTVKNAA